jgi:hypothetical protein
MALGPANWSCPVWWLGAILRDGKKKKKKDRDYQKPRSTALVVAAATGGQGDRDRKRVAAVHALCTRMVATAPRNVARSLTSQNVSASGASSPPKMAPCLAAGPARKRWTTTRWLRLNGNSVSVVRGGPEGYLRRRLLLR